MKKYLIFGIGNDNGMNHIILPKKQEFFTWFENLLGSLGHISPDVCTYEDGDKDYTTKLKQIKTMIDEYETYDVGDSSVRFYVFYGKEKIFITFHCDDETRSKFMKTFMKTSEFVK